MMTSYILSALLLFVLAASGLSAQSGDRILEPGGRPIMLGLYSGIIYNMHDGEFYTMQDGIVCCRFDNGSGIGAVGGVKAMIPVTENISISPRLMYENRGGTFISRDERYPMLGENNRVELVTFENRLDVKLHTVTVDAMTSYTIEPIGMYVTAGPSVSLVVGQGFSKTTSIDSPAGVRFLDGTTSRVIDPGNQDIVRPVLFSARGGVGALIELAENIYLNPEALYAFPLGNVSKQDNWKASGIQGTLGVMMAF
jgi:hypothetical protein